MVLERVPFQKRDSSQGIVFIAKKKMHISLPKNWTIFKPRSWKKVKWVDESEEREGK